MVVQNAIALGNALALDQAIPKARSDRIPIQDENLKHIQPTMVEHINFMPRFRGAKNDVPMRGFLFYL